MAFDIHKLADLDLGDTVRRCSTIEGFSDIETPGCGAVILDRTPLQASVDWLAQLSSDALPEERIVLNTRVQRVAGLSGKLRFGGRDQTATQGCVC